MNWKDKKCLVTGSEGLIGKELVIQLKELGADVYENDINKRKDPNLRRMFDITYKDVVEKCFLKKGKEHYNFDYIFHLAGIKGSPKMTKERPVDFMGPMLQFDTNMILAAQKHNVKRFLYTSSIAVEHPESDYFPAWAKQTAETLIEAMRVQYSNGTNYCIVRPANVYGRFDNFNRKDNMVITSLINKALSNSGQLEIWGNGSQIRDFINAKDVAKGMIKVMEEIPNYPVNLCSGRSETIKQVAEIISKETNKPIKYISTEGKILGDNKRVMKRNWDNPIEISLEEGIKEAIDYARKT